MFVSFHKPRKHFKYPKHILRLQSKKLKLWKMTKYNPALKFKYNNICSLIRNSISDFNTNRERKQFLTKALI